MSLTYRNGYIPMARLVTFKKGSNKTDGDWHHSLSPSTYRKHLQLVAKAYQRTGRMLAISNGWSAYRPYFAQVLAREIWGFGAAVPGTSSHGGFWEGKQTLAMDYGNWAWVYAKFGSRARAEFYADCRAVGLSPGLIHPSRGNGYPDEPWHVIDKEPWAAVPAGLGVEDMPLTKEDIAAVAKAVWNYMVQPQDENGRYVTGSFPARGFLSSIAAQVQATNQGVKALPSTFLASPIQMQDDQGNLLWQEGKPVVYPLRGYIGSIAGQVGGKPADVDESALAAELAPLLASQIGALSDADVERLATAVADEQARRMTRGTDAAG